MRHKFYAVAEPLSAKNKYIAPLGAFFLRFAQSFNPKTLKKCIINKK